MQKAIISSSNQIKRNLQLYTLGEVDEVWIKNHNGPIMQNKEDSQKESSSRESIGNIEDERYNLVEVCSRIRNKLDSAEEQQKAGFRCSGYSDNNHGAEGQTPS